MKIGERVLPKVWALVLSVVVSSLAVSNARADGIVIPDPPPGPDPVSLEESWLSIRYHRVNVRIEDQIAVTWVEQEFVNDHEWEVEGTYVFPLPESAAISEFRMWVDGKPVDGKILPAEEARHIYEDILRRRRDPALLEYVGRKAVQVRVFPIPAGESRSIDLECTQILDADRGAVEYSYPLNIEKFSSHPLESCSIHVEIQSEIPLHAIYSPTHQDRISINRVGDDQAVISYEGRDVLPDEDFELVYTVDESDVGLNVLPYAEGSGGGSGGEGTFLLFASPRVEVRHVAPKDVIFLLDTSGSMEGEKLIQAKKALGYVLEHLNPEDRFNIITFSSAINRYAPSLQPVARADKARVWVDDIKALGGTNINRGLLEASHGPRGRGKGRGTRTPSCDPVPDRRSTYGRGDRHRGYSRPGKGCCSRSCSALPLRGGE